MTERAQLGAARRAGLTGASLLGAGALPDWAKVDRARRRELAVLAGAILRARSGDAAYWMVNIARGIEQMDRIRFEAINPGFLMAATKPR